MRWDLSRRGFLRFLLGGPALAAAARARAVGAPAAMPTRPLGRTGFQARIFGLGGQATLEDPGKREEAVAIVHRALDLGVNYVDTSPVYGRGASETAIGEVMRTRRREVFLASKTHDRSYDGSMRLLEESLRRLQTDHLDLWQIHNIKADVHVDFLMSREGAVKALERARREGIVRHVGITGHKDPLVLRRAIERYPYDTILMALNAADRHESSFITHLLPASVERGLGIVGMKVPALGRIFRPDGIRTMEPAMRYVLTLPVSTIVVGISSVRELEENVRIAREFVPLAPGEMEALERLTKPYHVDALWYRENE